MKLREFNFNSIMLRGLCIQEEGATATDKDRCYQGYIGDVLRAIPIEWADREIKNTRTYFDIFVIELAPDLDPVQIDMIKHDGKIVFDEEPTFLKPETDE